MGSPRHTHTEENWFEVPEESSLKRSKKEEKRKRKLWEEEDLDDDFDSWDNDDINHY